MKSKVCNVVISEEELKRLLKSKIHYTGRCSDCFFSTLEARMELTCTEMTVKLFGVYPNSCKEVNDLLRDFLNKIRSSKRNKI